MGYDNAEISIRVRLPGGKIEVRNFALSPQEWALYGLNPLPKDHDNSWDPMAFRFGEEQWQRRQEGVNFLVSMFRRAIHEVIRGQDPVNGYSPEERKQFPT